MARYKIVHTTGNSQAGGDNGGFVTISKTSMLFRVKKAATPPTSKGIVMQIINNVLFCFMLQLFFIKVYAHNKHFISLFITSVKKPILLLSAFDAIIASAAGF